MKKLLPHLQDGTYRSTYPDGQPFSECTIKHGRMEGVSRRWHPNGVMSHEEHRQNGVLHGLLRQWNAQGELLGTCQFKAGTGILRQWHENGQLSLEISYFNGRETGRMRCWEKDGMLYGTRYYFEGKPISKKGYLEKCALIPELPRLEEEKTTHTLGNFVRKLKREKREQAKLGPTPEQLAEKLRFDDDCLAETKAKTSQEIIAWLTKSPKKPRELGEISRVKALKLAKKLYAADAKKIWVTNIERDPDGSEYSNKLILDLSEAAAQRSKIYDLCTDHARPLLGNAGPAIRMEKRYMTISLL
ncbi:MAG: toxin-antitoxin system YwqK family antitoxin [Verrucomicrobiota bacterium]